MTNIKEENKLSKPVNEKKERKEDTRISMIYILLITFLLIALLIYIYFNPHKPSETTSQTHSDQVHSSVS